MRRRIVQMLMCCDCALHPVLPWAAGAPYCFFSSVRSARGPCQWSGFLPQRAAIGTVAQLRWAIMTAVFAAGGYRYIPAVFQYSGGVAAEPRLRDRAGAVSSSRCRWREGFARIEQIDPRGGPPAHRVLRLRVALARAVHRGRVPRLQRDLCRHAAEMGRDDRRHQSGGAQQCMPGDRSAGRAVVPCLLLHGRGHRASAPTFVVAGSGEALEGKGNYRDHTVRRGETSPDAMREKARYVLGEMERRLAACSASPGPTRPPRRSTPCTTCIRSSPTRSCAAAPRTPG